jgi:hypothetical protein
MASSSPDAAERPPVGSHVHDVVDLTSGTVITLLAGGVPAPEERVERLGRIGFPGNVDVFGAPSHRLSPQVPYQPSPEGWLDAFEGTWSASTDNEIWWRLPATFDNYKATVNATFRGVAAGPRVLSLGVEVWPLPGRTGTIVVFVEQTHAEIPVATSASRTIDVAFTHDGSDSFTAMVVLRPGIYDFVVHSVTLRSPGIVVTQPQPTV